jgi:hypothetical protein
LAGAGQGASSAAVSEPQLAAAHRAMLQTKGLQFDFTTYKPPEPPGWLEQLAKALAVLAPVLKVLFWAGLAAVAALILYLIGRELIGVRLRRRPPKAKATPAEAWRPEPARARALLEDADRMAAQGRYDEAVRLLLHRSIDDFSGRRPGQVRPALTSRDIGGLAAMPARAREAFGRIAQAVETSFFAARPLDAAGFAQCRQAYERFAFPEVWA